MKKATFLIILLFAVAACNRSPKDDGTAPLPLFPQPQHIEAKLNGGYAVNMVTGDTIQPLVNTLGDTIKTGVAIPAVGKVIHPDSVAKPKMIKIPTTLTTKNAHPNRYKVPQNKKTMPVDESKLNKISVPTISPDDTVHYMLNSIGQKVRTGVPIPAKGKAVQAIQTKATRALPPALKDDAIANIQYLDVDQGMNSSYVMSILEDKNGNLWFGTEGGGVSKYNGESFTHYTEKEGLSNNYVWSILEDKNGNLWFGTYGGGVSKYNGESFTHYTEKEGLSNNYVRSILEDKNGNLWFGTEGGGVSKYNGESFTHYTEKEGLSNNSVRSILEDKNGNLWFGTYGGGVSKYNGESFTHYTEKEGLSNNSVRSILEDKNGNLWFGTDGGGVSKYNGESFTHYTEKEGLSNNIVRSILEDKNGNLWFGTDGGGVSKYNGESFTHYTEKEGLSNNIVRSILEDKNGNLWFGTYGGGVSKYNGESFTHYTEKEGLSNNIVWSILEDKLERVWVSTEKGQSFFVGGVGRIVHPQNEQEKTKVSFAPQCNQYTFVKADGLKGLDFFLNSALIDSKNRAWWGSGKGLVMLDLNTFKISEEIPQPRLTGLDINEQFIDYRNISDSLGHDIAFKGVQKFENYPLNLSLPSDKNHLTFHFAGIDWSAPHKIQYSYRMLGLDNNNWSTPGKEAKAEYRNLSYGTYTFQVRTIGASQHWSEPLNFTFTIRPPWWHTWWAYTAYAIFIVGSVFSYIRWRERALHARQKELEVKVDEATMVIRNQKEEVEKQKDVAEQQRLIAEAQKEIAEHRKEEVEEKNREILDSITYAKRIQTAILPPPRVVKEFLKNSFILYLPKDIVAGDFYWMDNVEDTIYFAACDCTGHGVPGAMVSVVCNNALNRSLNEFAEREPGRIFDRTRELVLENFSKSEDDVKDGMDASLCALNLQTMELQWAGANNPLWIYRAKEISIEEIKADKQPIGKGHEPKAFTTHRTALNTGDIIYLFTDGYADQFGGEKGKKLTRAKFREFLLSISKLEMDQQSEALLKFHNQYRSSEEQVDDICVMGVRI